MLIIPLKNQFIPSNLQESFFLTYKIIPFKNLLLTLKKFILISKLERLRLPRRHLYQDSVAKNDMKPFIPMDSAIARRIKNPYFIGFLSYLIVWEECRKYVDVFQ